MMKMNANKKIPVLDCILLPLVPLSMFTNDDSMISTDKSEYSISVGKCPILKLIVHSSLIIK